MSTCSRNDLVNFVLLSRDLDAMKLTSLGSRIVCEAGNSEWLFVCQSMGTASLFPTSRSLLCTNVFPTNCNSWFWTGCHRINLVFAQTESSDYAFTCFKFFLKGNGSYVDQLDSYSSIWDLWFGTEWNHIEGAGRNTARVVLLFQRIYSFHGPTFFLYIPLKKTKRVRAPDVAPAENILTVVSLKIEEELLPIINKSPVFFMD